MRRTLAGLFTAFVLSLFAASVDAQTAPGNSTRGDNQNAVPTTTRDDDFNLGWLGLAGLAGLIGLMPRDNRRYNRDQTRP